MNGKTDKRRDGEDRQAIDTRWPFPQVSIEDLHSERRWRKAEEGRDRRKHLLQARVSDRINTAIKPDKGE